MKTSKKSIILLIMTVFFITSFSNTAFAKENMDITYDIPSQALESDLSNSEKQKEREAYSKEAAEEAPREQEIPLMKSVSSASFKSLGRFTVSYAYAKKAKTSDKYPTKVAFTELKGFSDFDSAMSSMNSYYNKYINEKNYTRAYGMCIRNSSGKIIAMKTGRAYATPEGATMNIGSTYITKGHEMFYYGAKENSTTQSYAKVGISGCIDYVSSYNLTLIPRAIINGVYKTASSTTRKYRMSYYTKNSNGELVHVYRTLTNPYRTTYFETGEHATNEYSFVVDKAPSFMKTGTNYYSMDGTNFYTSIYLISSYKKGTYYPYFKYLPYRTKSTYTATQFNNRIKNYASSSILRGQGASLIYAQNNYGINALQELSFANLESAYGTSGYAISRNNLFGIAAVDSNPDNATYFKSAGDCIKRHAYRYLSQGYFDAKTDSRYFGTCPGDKKIGVNVKYASDPYHGEKIGGMAYTQDKLMGSKDYGRYTIGKTNTAAYVYKTPSLSGTKYYRLGTKGSSSPVGMTVAIIGTSGNFYKVQTDMGVVNGGVNYKNKYNFTNSIGYIPKSQVSIIRKGSVSITNTPQTIGTLTNMAVLPKRSYGFTPGFGNKLKVTIQSKPNYTTSYVDLLIKNEKNQIVAKLTQYRSTKKSFNHTFFWDGKATTGNTAGYKAGNYIKTSTSGITYKVQVRLRYKDRYKYTTAYPFKAYNTATKVRSSISKTSIVRKNSTYLSMSPNRPGTSYIRVYNSKGNLVFRYIFYYREANTKRGGYFRGYGNYGSYKGKLLAKGNYKVKFTHGNYTYTYYKTLVLR